MNKSDINFEDSVYEEQNVFEYNGSLYEDLRPYLHLPFNQDLVDDDIKFRVIFSEDDYDYIQDNPILTQELEQYRDNQS